MKIEFNTNALSANINGDECVSDSVGKELTGGLFKSNLPFFLGIIALVSSVINLPFGIFMNVGAELLRQVYEAGVPHWIFILFVASATIIAVSAACAVASIVLFAKAKKTSLDTLGLVLSILSFVISAICLVLNILGITVW